MLRYTILVGPRRIPIEIEHSLGDLPRTAQDLTNLVEERIGRLHMYNAELQSLGDKHQMDKLTDKIREILES